MLKIKSPILRWRMRRAVANAGACTCQSEYPVRRGVPKRLLDSMRCSATHLSVSLPFLRDNWCDSRLCILQSDSPNHMVCLWSNHRYCTYCIPVHVHIDTINSTAVPFLRQLHCNPYNCFTAMVGTTMVIQSLKALRTTLENPRNKNPWYP